MPLKPSHWDQLQLCNLQGSIESKVESCSNLLSHEKADFILGTTGRFFELGVPEHLVELHGSKFHKII
jgi:hypothetical protein